jgi:hypothetical protein
LTSPTTIVIILLLLLLPVPAVAAPIPDYFADEWVGFVCLSATPPGSGPTTVLVQINFDKFAFGGIALEGADSLFGYLTDNLGLLSLVLGNSPQKSCQRTPSQILAEFPGTTARQAAQLVSPTFQQLGFAHFIVVDTFLSFAVLYSGGVNTLRAEVFLVPGDNDLSFVLAHDLIETLLP